MRAHPAFGLCLAASRLISTPPSLPHKALENGQVDSDYPVGIVSVRDLLLSVTAQQMVPLLEWLDDERRSLIEERVGYSE